MTYQILAAIFLLTVIVSTILLIAVILKRPLWQRHKKRILFLSIVWLVPYFIFILFFTGPTDLSLYPSKESSPYKLPWEAGVSRLVAQGNRSFTSHRDFHFYAWDFVMANGTEILAARDGLVVKVEDNFDWIGLDSNVLIIEHEDGARSAYAHIRHSSSLVKVGERVIQGQPIALSGMVGQTIFPHVHFYVINKTGTSSIPISFSDVPGGVPMAGHFYTSENVIK